MKKRIGNDFLFYWIIKENNIVINPNDVLDFKIIIRHRRTGSEIVAEFDVVNSSPSIKCENLLYLGAYDLIATWKTVDYSFEDGFRNSSADVQAFEIVSSSSSECETDLTVTSEIAIGFEGADAFEVWLKNGNEGKTYDDYIAFLQKPATDAAALVGVAIENANEAAAAANESALLVQDSADNANAKAILANNAAILATEKASLADSKATLANDKAILAQSAADNANAKAAEVTAAVLSAGSLGSIKPTDAAPTPARNGNYTFSIGGNKPAWLTAEAGVTTVKAGDGVAVVYTEPNVYSYTHVDINKESEILDESSIFNRMLLKMDSPLALRSSTFSGEALNGATINLNTKTITVPANQVGSSAHIEPLFDGYSSKIQALSEGYIYSAMMFRCTRAADGAEGNFTLSLRSQSGAPISTWNRFFVHPNDPNVFFAISRIDKTKITGVTGLRFPLQLNTLPTATTDRTFTILDTVVYFDTQSRTEIEVEKIMLDSIITNSVALTTKVNTAIATEMRDMKKLITTSANQFINYNVAAVTDWLYGVGVYFGYNKPVLKDCLLDSITMSLFGISTSHIGTTRQFVIGTVDQRNWLLPRLIINCPISAVTSGKATFDFTALKIIMNAGEVVFAVSAPISGNASLGLDTSTYDSNNKLLTTSSLSNALVANTTKNANVFQLNVLDIDSVFVTKGSIDAINSKIIALTDKTAQINLYNDYITGDKYELKIVNGAIVVQLLQFQRILVIGHSFVNYFNSPEVDWNLDDGENRAMAASVNANQWTTFVKDKFGATLTLQSGVHFERNFSPTYDFATNWNVTNNYDAICVYLNENTVYNSTMQASWEAMLNYLKSAAPSAKIYCTGSWLANVNQQAIQAACNSVANITYVDLVGLKTVNNCWKRGDYYLGRANAYYPMGAANGHPNDKGHYDIANGFLLNMGQDQLTGKTHNISLVQATGGTIETPNTTWVKDGVVTIRINPTAGYNISSLNVVTEGGQTIATTQRTNNFFDGTNRIYYTFTMPAENVIVTPTWGAI